MNENGRIYSAGEKQAHYYPMYLSAGGDALLAGWNGGPVINYKKTPRDIPDTDVYWYKGGRFTQSGLAMAHPVSSAVVGIAPHEYRPKRFTQFYDPVRRILTTRISAMDQVEYTVTTFLHRNNLLVEHFELSEICRRPGFGINLAIWIEPGRHIANKPGSTTRHHGNGVLYIDYREGGLCGQAAVWGDCPEFSYLDNYGFYHYRPGECFTKYTCVKDNIDDREYAGAIASLVGGSRSGGEDYYREVLDDHVRFNCDYQQRSTICTPDKKLDYAWALAQSMIQANIHPHDGMWAVGALPSHWNQAGPLWDSFFPHRALLRTNHLAEGRAIVRNLCRREHVGKWRAAAEALGRPGIYTDASPEAYRKGVDPVFSNMVYAVMMFDQYRYSGDIEYLREVYPVLKSLVDFLVADAIEKQENAYVLRKCYPVDELKFNRYYNDTWSTSGTIAALRGLLEAARLLRRKLPADYPAKLAGLEQSLHRNFTPGGVLACGWGESEPRSGIHAYMVMPELPAGATIDYILQNVNEYNGVLPDIHRQEDVRKYPWLDFVVACAMGINGHPDTYSRIKAGLAQVNSLGGISESIAIDNSLYRQWFHTCLGPLLEAAAAMFAYTKGDELHVFRSVPPKWKNFCFNGLTMPGQLEVSGAGKNGRLELSVTNHGSQMRTFRLYGPKTETVSLNPGETLTRKY